MQVNWLVSTRWEYLLWMNVNISGLNNLHVVVCYLQPNLNNQSTWKSSCSGKQCSILENSCSWIIFRNSQENMQQNFVFVKWILSQNHFLGNFKNFYNFCNTSIMCPFWWWFDLKTIKSYRWEVFHEAELIHSFLWLFGTI